MIRLALYQPDIPQNTGTLLRLGACLDVPVDIIEPCGFPLSEKALRRSGMDYLELVDMTLHPDWTSFLKRRARLPARLVLLTTQADTNFVSYNFSANDILLLGRESAGVPSHVHDLADARLTIPMKPNARSLNVATAAAMVIGEALRQTGGI